MKAIEIENLTYRYSESAEDGSIRKQRALSDVSFSVEEGQFVCLVGHNGSGKSTLAKLLNGLILPESGEVRIFGLSTKEKKQLFEIRKNVGMVFQNPDNQMIATVVEDDVAFGPENVGLPREEILERVEWALSAVGMQEHRKGTPFRLSGGQKQRIAIAGTLAIKPRILVLDEATAMLDPRGRQEVMEVVKRLNKEEKITVIHITHFMDEVLESDRVIVLNEGKISIDGTPQEVFLQGRKLIEAGLRLPRAAVIAELLRREGIAIPKETLSTDQLIEELCRLLQKN